MGLSESELPGQSFTGTGHRTVDTRLGRSPSGPASRCKPSFRVVNIIDEWQSNNNTVVYVAVSADVRSLSFINFRLSL